MSHHDRCLAARWSVWVCILSLCLMGAGCQSTTSSGGAAGLSGGGESKSSVASGPAKDQVLRLYKASADHMRAARFAEAKPLLDEALLALGGIRAEDKAARRARGMFREESSKNFRGEPYERVMAYYYRGILYWMDGEPDNARACFRSAALEDSDPEGNKYQSDYVLLDYLDGFASAKLAGDGSDAYQRALGSVRLGVKPPPYDAKANVLVFLEMGQGPSKVAVGEHGQVLSYVAGRSASQGADLKIAGKVHRASVYDDLSFQATTRGGRVMDQILAKKAGFKEGTDNLGNAALISGAILGMQQGRRSNMDEVGLGLLAAGLVSKLVSAATTPRADTRQWDNLPNLLGFSALSLPTGTHTLVVDFIDAQNRVLASKQATFAVAPGKDVVLFFSDRN
jgi:tetratricopeptide (TPR) repeat protein